MKIVVLLKKTPDTETKIATKTARQLTTAQTKYITNPYDLHAIEEALKLKQTSGDAEIILASFTDPSTKDL